MKLDLHHARWIGFVAVVLLWANCCNVGGAAPVAFRGVATVARATGDYEYEGVVRRLPFAASVGETFRFLLVVDPQASGAGSSSGFAKSGSAAFRATIGGVQLRHDDLEVQVTNDWGVDILSMATGRIADMGAIVGDQILIQQPIRPVPIEFTGRTSGVGAPRFELSLGFLEYVAQVYGSPQDFPAILHDLSIPREASTWQKFSGRELKMYFENRTVVGAYITELVEIPEPSALSMIGCVCVFWLRRRGS